MQTTTAPPSAPAPGIAPASSSAPTAALPPTPPPAGVRRGWRGARTPTLLRAALAAAAALAVTAAVSVAATTASRRADVNELASSTAAVAIAAGDANAAFAAADAAAAALASPGSSADTELRFLQSMALGVNQLERAAALTNLGDPAEAPIRRALRSVETYGADVAASQTAASSNADASPAQQRASATMADLIRSNTERVATLHDDSLRQQARDLHQGRWKAVLLTLVPLVLLLAVLVATQILLWRRFHRFLNIPVALATLLTALVAVAALGLQSRQTSSLSAAVDTHYANAQALTTMRDLASRERAARIVDALRPGAVDIGPLRDELGTLAAATEPREVLVDAVARYQRAADQGAGAASVSTLFNVLDADLLQARRTALSQFDQTIADAQSGQATQIWLAPLLLVVVMALAWLGLQRRLAEYR